MHFIYQDLQYSSQESGDHAVTTDRSLQVYNFQAIRRSLTDK